MTIKQISTILTAVLCIAILTNGQTINEKSTQKGSNDTTLISKGFADNIPKPTGYINDFEKIFSESQIRILDSIVRAFEKETTIEIAIVTLDSSQTNIEEFDDMTLEIAKKWGVGKKDKNNGILIGISSSLRKMRIQYGSGIERVLVDYDTKIIIDSYFIPQFKKGDYYEGTRQGVIALINKLK